MTQVTVQRGDTLSKIAQRAYGDPNRWREIAQANGIRDPNRIAVGQVLALPGMDTDQGRAEALRGRQQALKKDLAVSQSGQVEGFAYLSKLHEFANLMKKKHGWPEEYTAKRFADAVNSFDGGRQWGGVGARALLNLPIEEIESWLDEFPTAESGPRFEQRFNPGSDWYAGKRGANHRARQGRVAKAEQKVGDINKFADEHEYDGDPYGEYDAAMLGELTGAPYAGPEDATPIELWRQGYTWKEGHRAMPNREYAQREWSTLMRDRSPEREAARDKLLRDFFHELGY